MLNTRSIRHVCSLGTHCYAAWLLQREGLRTVSGPFDWMFSDSRIVFACLDDGFKQLLDASQYYARPESVKLQIGHKSLLDGSKRVSLWPHHDPRSADGYNKLQRSIARFEALSASDDAKLFLMVSGGHVFDREIFDKTVSHLRNKMTNFYVLAVTTHSTKIPAVPSTIAESGDFKLISYFPSSQHVDGLSFANEEDNQFIISELKNFAYEFAPSNRPITRDTKQQP